MTDAEIRAALRPHKRATDGDMCFVESAHLDPAIDRTEIAAWVRRQEHGRVMPIQAVQSGGMRPGRLSAPASGYTPASERYTFPCSALDGD
jgi:hypothetical protein